jgi:hypothetical protein
MGVASIAGRMPASRSVLPACRIDVCGACSHSHPARFGEYGMQVADVDQMRRRITPARSMRLVVAI